MFDGIINFFKKFGKSEQQEVKSKDTAKERLHLVLMQDRANVSADFLEMMKQEIIDVIKKYITVDENEIDVRLTNKTNDDGTSGAPALYANIPIVSIKNENKELDKKEESVKVQSKKEDKKETSIKEEPKEDNKKEDKKQDAKKESKEIKEDKKIEQNKKEPVKEEKKESKENTKKITTVKKTTTKKATKKTTSTKKANA